MYRLRRPWTAPSTAAAALVRPVWRGLPWRVWGVAQGAGTLAAGLIRVCGGGPLPALVLLRAAVLAGALGLAFLLDDPARHTTATVPVRRVVRTALRVALVAPVVAVWWTAVLLLVPGSVRPPVWDITLEAGTASVLALAAATVAVRRTDEPEPGRSVATALLAGAVLAPLLLPARWALFVAPGDPGWAAAHERWAWVLAGAAALWAVSLREPRRRRTVRAPLRSAFRSVFRSPCGTSGLSRTC
ncbi:ABC transporter [Streptomyces alanosinicus]|uniref:ABC transporter n=1 Tax=Streptomyces alanosinicus TaxID=68171 RepID=A0A918YEI7_9ACTN|nr:ABC transporter [Streptomyces alanosinicus]GHD99924.1 ABC transporter [Streptomyces alanosinicus]